MIGLGLAEDRGGERLSSAVRSSHPQPAREADHQIAGDSGEGAKVSRYSLDEFLTQTTQQDQGQGFFELEGDRMLEVNLGDPALVWTKVGAMTAYQGNMRFTRESVMEHGLGKMVKRSLNGDRSAVVPSPA